MKPSISVRHTHSPIRVFQMERFVLQLLPKFSIYVRSIPSYSRSCAFMRFPFYSARSYVDTSRFASALRFRPVGSAHSVPLAKFNPRKDHFVSNHLPLRIIDAQTFSLVEKVERGSIKEEKHGYFSRTKRAHVRRASRLETSRIAKTLLEHDGERTRRQKEAEINGLERMIRRRNGARHGFTLHLTDAG